MEIRIFWPSNDDTLRKGGITDLIMQLPGDEREAAIKQLQTYRYDLKEMEYSTKVLCADCENSYGDQNSIIAYTLYRKSWIRPNTFEIAQTLVSENYRNRGVAKQLRKATFDDIRFRGGNYIISATKDTSHMKDASRIDWLPDGWKIMARWLNFS